jgi:hypothetical protein
MPSFSVTVVGDGDSSGVIQMNGDYNGGVPDLKGLVTKRVHTFSLVHMHKCIEDAAV